MLRAKRWWSSRELAQKSCLVTFLFTVSFVPGCSSDEPSEERETLRVLILTGEETDARAVATTLQQTTGRTADVSRLFSNVDSGHDPDSLAQMFVAIIPNGKAVSETEWDRAYALRDATGYARVEPDTEYTLEQVSAANKLKCFLDESEAPVDKDWSLKNMEVRDAWALPPPPGGRQQGEGIRVCHPDTGWAAHREMNVDRLDLISARNFVGSGPENGRDPLDYSGALLNPGHGTGTGTVIISKVGDGEIDGVAPKATLIPIRTAKSVIQVFDSDLAKSVRHSTASDCDVISMSLGGRGFFGLAAAIRDAKRNNVIVMAAAGNCVRVVVAPAAYESCIAVGATGIGSKPWGGSSRGRKIDISAPGEFVWTAHIEREEDPLDTLKAKQGTSFAVANTAGVAALWLAHHDIDRNTITLPEGTYVQDVFLDQLIASASVPTDWPTHKGRYGAGIVNARQLLERPIPDEVALSQRRRAPLREQSTVNLIANIIDRDAEELAAQLQDVMDVEDTGLAAALDMYGAELIQLAMRNPDDFERMLSGEPGDDAGTARRAVSGNASRRLRKLMR